MAEKLDDGGGKTGRKKVAESGLKVVGGADSKPEGEEEEKKGRVITPSNLTAMRKELADFFELMDKKKDDQEKLNGEFSQDFKDLKERFANKTGKSQRLLAKLYAVHRTALKMEKWRKEAEKAEVDNFDELMAASEGIKDTPLWRSARERVQASS